MLGVPWELIKHELHLDPKAKPVEQRLCHFTQDKKDGRKREIARLLDAGLLRKCTTRIGSPISFFYPKRIKIGGCVLIILILIRQATIRLWTPQPVAAF
jgi:hypothetical protein